MIKNILAAGFTLIVFGFISGCDKTEDKIPVLSRPDCRDINLTSIEVSASVTSDGGSDIMARGICWSLSPNPVREENSLELGSGIGDFSGTIENLFEATNYYLRAWAENSQGLAYREELACSTGELTNIDGKVYRTVRIGEHVWMLENLRTMHFNDGTEIPLITEHNTWIETNSPAMVWQNNDESNFRKFGALYNWYAASSPKICPEGWRVPSNEDWQILFDYYPDIDLVGGILKETGTENWISPNRGATNESGFTAQPGSFRGRSQEAFSNYGFFSYMWANTSFKPDSGLSISLQYNSPKIFIEENHMTSGLTIRCIMDN